MNRPVKRPAPARAGSAVEPPPVRPTVVFAGTGQHGLAAALLGMAVPESAPSAFVVFRHGPAGARAFIPGHREPRDIATGTGPLTRPPRRVALSVPAPTLEYVHLIVAPDGMPGTARTTVVADAVRCADGLVYLIDAGEPLSPARRAELAALAAVAGRVVLIAVRDSNDAERAAVVGQIPALAAAVWYPIEDVTAIAADLRSPHWLSGPASARVPTPRSADPVELCPAPVVTGDDAAWRQVLATRLGEHRSAVKDLFADDLDALVERCGADPLRLPEALDTELHALSLRASACLDMAARDLVAAVFSAVVEGRLRESDLVRVTTALWRRVEPDDRTLLVTATAGVAAVSGAADAVSATGLFSPSLLPPVNLAVSGNCHLMWHYRGVPDQVAAREWLHHAAESVHRAVDTALDARFAELAEAVGALAGDAVDHGVLLA
ncbi:hypothetical protein [Virgisporangium aurantiacum]|uniref:Dynamin family protein n=1 Tax=Virgisporangium aurantiacum TaxID=175570 RepID=A0A8J3ZAC6_9ACTN|nr:hypothetical protein [Virgisporangium aurantiacum]GIJ57950.1 hypothetical protein Vau01_054660 [Virgisporangium aurantiacum]